MEKYRKAVFIVTYARTEKGIKYLILKRKLHWKGWEFPKGGVKFLEPRRMTVRRELKEEIGLKPIQIKGWGVSGRYRYNKKFPDRIGFIGQTFSLYAAEVEKQKVNIDKIEHSDFEWVNFKEASKKLTWPDQKKCLKIVDDWLKKCD
ncbi:MAG: NUDIX domain-containing protein [Nanoarchaeota archaeon]